MPECLLCKRSKQPLGRSSPMAAYGAYCDSDCDGYMEPPKPTQYWNQEDHEAHRGLFEGHSCGRAE